MSNQYSTLYNTDEFVAFSDIQFYKNASKSTLTKNLISSWLQLQLDAFDYIMQYCISHKIKIVFHGGDLFEEKTRIPQDLYNCVWDKIESYIDRDLTIVLNTGNHDLLTLKGTSSLRPFSKIATVVTKPSDYIFKNTYVRVIPFGLTFTENALDLPSTDKVCVLMTHEDLSGLTYGASDFQSDNPIPRESFNKWKYVFNGHIHKPQTLDNIVNMGSPLIQSFSEEGETKYFYHYKDGEYKKIIIPGVSFNTVDSLTDRMKAVLLKGSTNNYYRVNVSAEEVSDPIFKLFNVSPNIVKSSKRKIRLQNSTTIEDEIKTYIESTKTTLDKGKLITIGRSLTKEK